MEHKREKERERGDKRQVEKGGALKGEQDEGQSKLLTCRRQRKSSRHCRKSFKWPRAPAMAVSAAAASGRSL